MSVKLLTEHNLEFLSLKEAAQARLSLHLSKYSLLEITCHGSIIITLLNHVYCTSRLGKVHCPIVAFLFLSFFINFVEKTGIQPITSGLHET